MTGTGFDKEQKLSTLLYTVKILAILFSVIPIFQVLFNGEPLQVMTNHNIVHDIIQSLIILMIILFLIVVISSEDKFNSYILEIFEIALFLALFYVSIYLSGKNESYYKFLYLFLIVYTSIKYSTTVGMIVTTISSLTIFYFDIYYSSAKTNIYIENDLALVSMFFTIAFIIARYSKLQKQHIESLKDYANTDGLTGIYNHRCFYDILNSECKKSIIEDKVVSVAILDIDNFKLYNDIYGHQQGDMLLCELVSNIKEELGGMFTLYRYGGEEFSIIFPDLKLATATNICESVRLAVENHRFYGEEVFPHKTMTISIGVAEFDKNSDVSNVVKNADSALFRAKHLKRNCVESYVNILDEYSFTDIEDNSGNLNKVAINRLFDVIKNKDVYTYNHMERVANYCDLYAKHFNFPEEDRKTLLIAAYLHDIGKVKIDSEILKTGKKLTDEQWNELLQHPSYSATIIKKLGGNTDIVEIVEQHHERVDGKGYPNHLKCDDIKEFSKILSVADSFDAMTNNRPYNKKKSFNEGFEELINCSNKQFDKVIAQNFIEAFKSCEYYI